MQKLRSQARVVKSVASGRLARSRQTSGPAASAKSRLSSGAETGPRRRSYAHLPGRKPRSWSISTCRRPGSFVARSAGDRDVITRIDGKAVALRNRSRPRSSRASHPTNETDMRQAPAERRWLPRSRKPVGSAGDERQGDGGLAFPGLGAERPQLPVPDMDQRRKEGRLLLAETVEAEEEHVRGQPLVAARGRDRDGARLQIVAREGNVDRYEVEVRLAGLLVVLGSLGNVEVDQPLTATAAHGQVDDAVGA